MKLCKDCKYFRGTLDTCENPEYVPRSYVNGKFRLIYASSVRMEIHECGPNGNGWVQKRFIMDKGTIMYIIAVVIAVTIAIVTSQIGGK